jgi:hypothetical protein
MKTMKATMMDIKATMMTMKGKSGKKSDVVSH